MAQLARVSYSNQRADRAGRGHARLCTQTEVMSSFMRTCARAQAAGRRERGAQHQYAEESAVRYICEAAPLMDPDLKFPPRSYCFKYFRTISSLSTS